MVELSDIPDWYKDAVIYEVHVRAFGDSNADGIGDFPGLTDRLDHLQNLGATAIWLLPFYPSPLRDDGYDIADYGGINPAYGTLADFRRFLREAHRRGLRVITELVLNHTSDQHPWFQKSRHASPGSRWRDFYVWSDQPDRYPEVRVIFEDYEASNWTWDPVAGAYYWHRFFHHQPDLNFDNPEVRATMLRVVDRWFEMGVDGVRLDAVPYLFERDGTNCENLPETHAFLKELRAHVDAHFPNRMLLAEANQWPEDAVAYFGDGDECHMAFHFPVMPRLFMALRMEDRHPIIDILEQTPAIPDSAQWAIFLRNHDELTLEMVTDEERDYMYRAYAADPQARVNLGIRRRLAPLMQNDRRKIELMNGLLFSLPGTPVIYYGDELGMGDNVYLGDRDSVRTPMQWSADRNAGFSRANPQQLYLPTIIDPEYHFETVNVEAQQENPSSLLQWMRRIIALRQRHPVFGRGSLEFLYPENAKVLAFLRTDEQEQMLVVANLSRFAQSVHLDLHEHRGAVPIELFGGSSFPQVGEGSYHLTLGPYGFFWFRLDTHQQEAIALHEENGGDALPELKVTSDWRTLLRTRARVSLERALPQFLERNRWYAGRTRSLRTVEIEDVVPLAARRGRADAFLTLLHVEYDHGEPETYVVPLTVAVGEAAEQILTDDPDAAVAWVQTRSGDRRLLLIDATADEAFATTALSAVARQRRFDSPSGAAVVGSATTELRRTVRDADDLTVARIGGEQSNTSRVYGNTVVFKMFRRAQDGVNPDLELGRFLTEQAQFPHTARLLGALEYQRSRRSEPRTLGVLTSYVPNEGDAWNYTLDAIGLFYETASASRGDQELPEPDDYEELLLGRAGEPPADVAVAIGPYLDSAQSLGGRTAELHRALAGGTSVDFAPEPFTQLWQRSLYQSMQAQVRPTLAAVRRMLSRLDDVAATQAEAVLAAEDRLVDHFSVVRRHLISCSRIRVHGDLHLGQVLHAGRDFVFIDFEGEPSRSPSERRIKRSALVDVAGMVRSFQYAADGGLWAHLERGLLIPDTIEDLARRARVWQYWVTNAYIRGYLDEARGEVFVPEDDDDLRALLRAFLLEKALYEVRYDLAHRPHWAGIPLTGVLQLLGR
ncbi:MAG: maltose alpha-D-glucosyltransferase [Acidimicrobiia bacterium]|nr:maltose alpha-D-glucosyltransferase [Acidimicrobiia bacterium]